MREQLQKQPVGQESLNQTTNQIMHIALVGVRPGDKILLKEYFKKLLDLRIAVEWVLISYPNVDLFLIGKEFRDSAVVTKLLADQEHKPVLYVSSQEGVGEITADSLILPLASLDELDKWLLESVAILGADNEASSLGDSTDTPVSDTASNSADLNNQSSLSAPKPHESSNLNTDASTQRSATSLSNPERSTLAKPKAQDTTQTPLSLRQASNDVEGYQHLIELAEQIEQRQQGLFQITSNQQVWAILEPRRGRLWQIQSSGGALSLDWQLTPYDGVAPANEEAYDLVQYLWQCAWLESELLIPLMNHQLSYQLKYWIKPVLAEVSINKSSSVSLNKQDRQHLLAVMNALELAPRNICYLSELTATSTDYIQKLVASLWFAGSIQALADTDTQSIANTSNSDHTNSATDADVAAQQEKQGFLSRLRRKLGL